jgi:4-amino-4-deoxy-L-arabinose transferase-like glycosyltransferase
MSDSPAKVRRRFGAFALVAFLALVIRGVYVGSLSEVEFLKYDGVDYRDIAKNIAHGHGFTIDRYRWFEPRRNDAMAGFRPELHRPPLLPYVGAVLHAAPGGFLLAAKILSILIGSLAVFGVGRLADEIFGRTVGVLAAILVALHPYLIDISCRWSTENFMMLAALLGMLAMQRFISSSSGRWAAGSGAFFAVAVLARPTAVVILLLVGGWIAIRALRRREYSSIVAFAVAATLVLLSWTARNAIVGGRATPLTAFGPYNMRIGMNDVIRDFYRGGAVDVDRANARVKKFERREIIDLETRGLTSVDAVNEHWNAETREYVRSQPLDAAFIVGARALHFWRPWTHAASGTSWPAVASGIWAGGVLLAAIASVARNKSSRTPVLILPIFGIFLASLPFVFNIRYRLPVVEPILSIWAAEFLVRRRLGAARDRIPGERDFSNFPTEAASLGCERSAWAPTERLRRRRR